MNVQSRQSRGVTILTIEGAVQSPDDAFLLREKTSEALNAGSKKILLNLAGVPQMSSVGFGGLITIHTMVSNGGGALKLACLTKVVRDLMEITRLISVFETYDNEAEALGSF